MTIRIKVPSMLLAGALLALSFANNSIAGGAREDVRLQKATQILQEVQAMPDQRVPDTLLAHAYGIAVIPDVTQIALVVGGRHGNGVLTVRDTLSSPWSNPVFISLTGGSAGLQVGLEASDIILVFTTKDGVDGIALGKLTLGADASVAAGPVGRQGTAATDVSLAEIYSYARTRGLFGGIALNGTAITIDKSANSAFYGKPGVMASEILSGSAPTPPEPAQHFLARLAQTTHSAVRGSPAPQADVPASAAQVAPAAQVNPVAAPTVPAAAEPRTYPLESPSPN
jgi:lipid-binding SYLF domain-containing protein